MIRVVIVLPQQAEGDVIEESLMGMPITTARISAARTAVPRMWIRILLTVQGNTQRDQSPGIALKILVVSRHFGKVIRYDFGDVRGDPACLSTSFAEAMKSQVLLRLAE